MVTVPRKRRAATLSRPLAAIDKEIRAAERAVKQAQTSGDMAQIEAEQEYLATLRLSRRDVLDAELGPTEAGQLVELERQANELAFRIEERQGGAGIIAPPKTGTAGIGFLSRAQLEALAHHEGLDPTKADWWDSIDSKVVAEFRGRMTGLSRSPVADLRRALKVKQAEIRHLSAGGSLTGQTPRGKAQDRRRTAKVIAPAIPTTAQGQALVDRWESRPGQLDREGTDTQPWAFRTPAAARRTASPWLSEKETKPPKAPRIRATGLKVRNLR